MSDSPKQASGKNVQIEAYRGDRSLKHHDRQLLDMIRKNHPEFRGSLLDIGCAAGVFIENMLNYFPDAHYTGFDTSEELVDNGKQILNRPNVELIVADVMEFTPSKKFDILIASGVLSIWEDFTEPLEKMLPWMNDSGCFYIFGRFNSANVDTIVRFRNNHVGGGWEGGLNSYSIHTVGDWLENRGYKAEFSKFELPIELEKSENPIRTWTVISREGEKLILNGANTVAEFYFLSVLKN
ncbi:class I SAM-dependent methyltransferase [bacterium]|nr:class I SAM-dependent methyltransferase [bacterium]